MFNAKKRLLNYMEEKNEMVLQESGLNLYYKKDFEQAKNLTHKQTKKALNGLKENTYYGDSAICPQCIIFKCYECPYGENHGLCNNADYNDQYTKILGKLDDVAITGLFTDIELKTYFKLM